jgi:site-specific DNA-cytosine methylase
MVLIACEESQVVTIEFRKLGIEAYSCDIIPCSGKHPEWHIQTDVRKIINSEWWNLIIAFPPCQHLSVSGARWFKEKQKDGRQQAAIDFFLMFANAKCNRIAIENPVSIMSTIWRKPDQIIHPWQFGEPESKTTCLWFKNLPKLEPTNILTKTTKYWNNQTPSGQNKLGPSKDRARIRSKTYRGIAEAMASQWGKLL